ncbi:MAG: N-6 DNA methylase [Sphingobacteriales bacterium]|nr:N-6 DNA methylase [Sphingobacteriales bacterium]
MSLFQQSVVKKYLNDLDKETMQQRWAAFTAHFHNAAIQQNILNNKEEEYQEGFVRDLFVNVLGYTLNPQPDYNFVLEKKTEADSTKSDGAILHGGKVVAVIELKDTTTTDLDKIEKQAFGYKHRHPDCTYVITANFQKLRFYINDAIEYEEFDLFTLTQDRFALLYLCLSEQTIFKNIPLLIKQASLTQEEAVTKQLYADYSGFRKKLFYNIVELNPQYSKIELFKKTQKLLDRFLFILFAEDRLLVPANSVRIILVDWEKLKDLDNYVPLYDRFRKYFGYLNTGHEGKHQDIFAYNGGLFAADEILDHIKIDDTILHDSCIALSNYDFQTEIDVNILGHIFEHSLNEIEELQAEAAGNAIDKAKTKRKKDGIFYTPRYITKYIVANTVGALCEQKKNELSISEEVFAYRKQKDKKRERLVKLLDEYRHWLLQLTICDPACGSGAFLNQALEYLIAEHRHIDELKANLFGDAFVLTDLDNEILEKNLYGVDINEEAVEIARLSLWLRTAKKDRKLSSLTSHIQCGNSLIDDPAVAGDKAFNWQKAFPKIFEKGGFDVVIGNPPYVFAREKITEADKKYYAEKYHSALYQVNTYLLFIERSNQILKTNGSLGLIVPNAWLMVSSAKNLREYLIKNVSLKQIINLLGYSFENVNVETIILIAEKNKQSNNIVTIKENKGQDFFEINTKEQNIFSNEEGFEFKVFADKLSETITQKLKINSEEVDSIATVKAGLQAYEVGKGNPKQTKEDVENRPYDYNHKLDDSTYMYLDGKDVGRYSFTWAGMFLKYGDHLAAPRTFDIFSGNKIIVREITGIFPKCIISTFNDEIYLFNRSNIAIVEKDESLYSLKYILAIINSTLLSFYFIKNTPKSVRQMFPKVILQDLRKFPVKIATEEQQLPFIAKADIMLATNKELQELKQQLLQLLQSNFPAVQLNKKLEQWPSLSFADFLKELSKQKIKPALPQQAEWMNYFEEQKTKALALQTIIDTTDKEIDAMVYALYGLTDEEIKIVEGN